MIHSLPLNQEWIDSQALKLVKKLQSHNHTTYLVGGCVRDLLVGLPPKDFDIATSALPAEVNKIIRPSHIIGKRFQLVLVKRFGEQYEISTFRAQSEQTEEEGPIMDDNTFGSPEEDARRRDFTINSFFYDPISAELHDYCEGMQDIQRRLVRMIGDPETRIQEDPLRMLRAVRFAHKANFTIEENLRTSITNLAPQLTLSVLPRRREELLKFLRLPNASNLIWECFDLNLLKAMIPSVDHCLSQDESADRFTFALKRGLSCLSDPKNPNELFGVFLFALLLAESESFCEELKLPAKRSDSLTVMMKEELGMYRNEQDLFFQTLDFIKQLQGIKKVEKIRNRYKIHLLKSHSMSTALTLAWAYHLLPAADLHFWASEYWNQQQSPD